VLEAVLARGSGRGAATALTALQSLALVSATALAILSIPGYLAASTPVALALQD
jgi:hypothetical protein